MQERVIPVGGSLRGFRWEVEESGLLFGCFVTEKGHFEWLLDEKILNLF